MFKKIKNIVFDILFPPLCFACQKCLEEYRKNKIVCQKCCDSIPIYDSFFCPTCLARIPGKKLCHNDNPYLLAPVSHYDNLAVKSLICQFKYEGWSSAAQELFKLTDIYFEKSALGRIIFQNFFVMPIPLHENREYKRGFNQALILADHISRNFNIPLIKDDFIRIKDTESQAKQKNYRTRQENIKEAFKINCSDNLKGKNIILVDDVFTSGATMNEAVKTLKEAGVKKIIAFVLARAR